MWLRCGGADRACRSIRRRDDFLGSAHAPRGGAGAPEISGSPRAGRRRRRGVGWTARARASTGTQRDSSAASVNSSQDQRADGQMRPGSPRRGSARASARRRGPPSQLSDDERVEERPDQRVAPPCRRGVTPRQSRAKAERRRVRGQRDGEEPAERVQVEAQTTAGHAATRPRSVQRRRGAREPRHARRACRSRRAPPGQVEVGAEVLQRGREALEPLVEHAAHAQAARGVTGTSAESRSTVARACGRIVALEVDAEEVAEHAREDRRACPWARRRPAGPR